MMREVQVGDRVMHTGDSTLGTLVVESLAGDVATVAGEGGKVYRLPVSRLAHVTDWAPEYTRWSWRQRLKDRLFGR